MTLAEVRQAYVAAGHPLLGKMGFKRAITIRSDGYRWSKHLSRIGHLAVAKIDTPTVQRFLDTLTGHDTRSHALLMLKGLLRFAKSRGLTDVQEIAIAARPSRKVQNFLKPGELRRLDAVLAELANENPGRMLAFNALRVLLHTGMRKGEVLGLEWSRVDLEHRVIHLAADKASGENVGRDVLLSDKAVEVLRSLPRIARGRWVFFGRHRDAPLVQLAYSWKEALKRAGIKRIRIHDLRHSFASAAIGRGTSLFTTGRLLGHRSGRSTERYSHLSAEAAREALDRVADALS